MLNSSIFKCQIVLLLLIVMIAPMTVQAKWFEGKLSPARQVSDADLIEKLQNHDLAYGFLSSEETLQGQLGMAYQNLSDLQKSGRNIQLKLNYVMQNPDGTIRRVVLDGFKELSQFIDQIRRDRDNYARHIRHRGFRTMTSNYEVEVSDKCPGDWFKSGMVRVEQTDFQLVLRQGDKTFKGAAVGNAILVVFPGGQLSPLKGLFSKLGHIDFTDIEALCKIRFTPNKGVDLNYPANLGSGSPWAVSSTANNLPARGSFAISASPKVVEFVVI